MVLDYVKEILAGRFAEWDMCPVCDGAAVVWTATIPKTEKEKLEHLGRTAKNWNDDDVPVIESPCPLCEGPSEFRSVPFHGNGYIRRDMVMLVGDQQIRVQNGFETKPYRDKGVP